MSERSVEVKLDVPYVSQFLAFPRNTLNAVRACGITCVYMVMKYLGVEVSSVEKMFEEGIELPSAYSGAGWKHSYFVSLFTERGYSSCNMVEMKPRQVSLFVRSIDNSTPVIVSVTNSLLTKNKFHMVLITGYRKSKDGKLLGFFVHDPESIRPTEKTHLFVDLKTFKGEWRRMAIFPEFVAK